MNKLERWIAPLTRRLWPDLEDAGETNRIFGMISFVIILYAAPLAVTGLVWLTLRSDFSLIIEQWPLMLLLMVLTYLFNRFVIFTNVEIVPGIYATSNTQIETLAWSLVLIFGPTVIWIEIVAETFEALRQFRSSDQSERWELVRDTSLRMASMTLSRLLGLVVYVALGGQFPLAGFDPPMLFAALAATAVDLVLGMLVNGPMLAMVMSSLKTLIAEASPFQILINGLRLWAGANVLISPITVLVAALYVHSGLMVYLLFIVSTLIAAGVASRLSNAVEETRQRSRELEQLELLGRALLQSSPDGSELREVLATHIPGMFTLSGVEVHLYPDETLIRHGEGWERVDRAAWGWLRNQSEVHTLTASSIPPWDGPPLEDHMVLIPMLSSDDGNPLGGICVVRSQDRGEIDELVPAARTLTAQVASALHRAGTYRETLAHQRTQQEVAVAARVQASFLPSSAPEVEGWQISAALESARETSGDFFDLIPMWDGRLGIVVADVADKGLGAALFMALSRTLLRTYATEYSTRHPDTYAFHPERVLDTVNQCIIQDTQSDLFVTVFFGIIDPKMSTLTYANAGHNPPYLFTRNNGDIGQVVVHDLKRTGIPVGIISDTSWDRGSVKFEPGDVLVVYTDGLVDAENASRDYYGTGRLMETVHSNLDSSAGELRALLLDGVRDFVGDTPSIDDITLMVVKRAEAGLIN